MTQDQTGDPAELYAHLRTMLLDLDPVEAGLTPPFSPTGAWGCVMESGFAEGAMTLVALADGTTSLYTSTGFGIIGGGAHEAVVRATLQLLRTLDDHLEAMTPSVDRTLPSDGRTVLRALTPAGPRLFEADEDDLGHGRSPLSPVFHAAHAVIGELRQIEESGSS